MADRSTPSFPLADFLGMETRRTGEGTATAQFEIGPEHLNPHGSVHGAVLFALIDTAMGAATLSVLPPGQLCASIDVELRFCRPRAEGVVVATAQVLHAGKRVVHLEARVHDEPAGELVAFATGSFAVVGATAAVE